MTEKDTQTKPLISVIIPCYNVAMFFNRCIDSILEQTYTHLEILLIDDGSTDNTSELCDAYALQDKRIAVIHQQNKGLPATRKVGIAKAKGNYCFFIDADDTIEPNTLEYLMSVALQYPQSEAIVTGYQRISPTGEIEYCSKKDTLTVCTGIELLQQESFFMNVWGKLFRTSFLKAHMQGFVNNVCFGEDLLFFLINIYSIKQIVLTPTVLYNYIITQNSMAYTINKWDIERISYEALLEQIKLLFPLNRELLNQRGNDIYYRISDSLRLERLSFTERTKRLQSLSSIKDTDIKLNIKKVIEKIRFWLFKNGYYKLFNLITYIRFYIKL